jgi:hypothetical protein
MLWGRNDQAVNASSTSTVETSKGAPIGTYVLVKSSGSNTTPVLNNSNAHFGNTSAGSRANVDLAMYNNTTMSKFIPGQAVGIFGASATEVGNTTFQLATTFITNPGSVYNANAVVTLTVTNGGTSGVVNATSNSTGRISALNIQTSGTGYRQAPTIAIAAPAAIFFSGNTNNIDSANKFITLGTTNAAFFVVNDSITYTVAAANTAVGNLTSGSTYFVSYQNSTGICVSATLGGANIVIGTAVTTPQAGHSFVGKTATGVVTVSATGYNGIAHAGWVVRREGSGGRAGRVHYETLVAFGSLGINTTTSTGVTGNTSTVTDSTVPDNTVLPGV